MQASHRPVLLTGRFDRREADVVVRAASAASFLIEAVPSESETRDWLAQHDPTAVVVNLDTAEAEGLCLAVRSDPGKSLVPILGVTREISDLAFSRLYGFGADDLVELSGPERLERRFRAIPLDMDHAPPAAGQTVLLGDADDRRRLLTARVLRNAGFDVQFAVNGAELSAASVGPHVVLVVAEVQLGPDGAVEAARVARDKGCSVPWIIASPPRLMGETSRRAQAFGGVVVADAFAPLENLMFVANEVLRPSLAEKRSSARLLYGATVGFRVAGRDRDEHGFVYNLSAEGLYVRTLAPLAPGDEAWVEVQPPRTDRRVRLEAKVVWRRQFGGAQGATVPPGFGLFITGGSTADMKRYRQGYETFGRELAAERLSVVPTRSG